MSGRKTKTTEIQHPAIGRMTLSTSRSLKRISLSIRPPDKVRLSFPTHIGSEEALRFAETKLDWIRKTLAKYADRKADSTVTLPFRTRHHDIVASPSQVQKPAYRIKNGITSVIYPATLSWDDDAVQSTAKKAIEETWRLEAKEILPLRLRQISESTGLRFRSATIRNTVSKWGSCSARDDISLSLHMMRLPDHLIDYILIHELCHTLHKNHGPKFHTLLNQLTACNHPNLRRELKNYHTRW